MKNLESRMPSQENKPTTKIMTFEKDGQSVEVECKIVNLNTPEYDQLLENASLFKKNAEVQARKVEIREEIATALDATKAFAEPGDWIITNPGGEAYKIKDETFQNAYEPKEGEDGTFLALGVPVKAVQVNENIVFKAPWGSDQGVQASGYIVERQDNKERYGIEEEAFDTTYEAIEEEK